MAQISNKSLALLVLAALAVVVTSTVIQLSTINDLGFTGKATSDSGFVNLSISSLVNIQVETGNDTINFGVCTPPSSGTNVSDSNDTIAGPCNGDTTSPQFIRILNIGNVDVNVTVAAECTVAQFIPETSGSEADFQVKTAGNGCVANNISTYTTLETTALLACGNLTKGAYLSNNMELYAKVTIPFDALTGAQAGACSDGQNTLTFTAEQI